MTAQTYSGRRNHNILPKHLSNRRPNQLKALRIRGRNRRRFQPRCPFRASHDIERDAFAFSLASGGGTVARGGLVERNVFKAELVC